MCCSTLTTKGGMVSVVKNYLSSSFWKEHQIIYIPTHFDTNKYLLILYFGIAYLRVLLFTLFSHYQVVHLHTSERGSFWRKSLLLNTLKAFGKKTILHHHGAEFDLFFQRCSAKQQSKIIRTLEQADLNIVLSQRLVNMIKEKAPKAKVAVLYNSVNTYPSIPYNQKAKNILFLGRLGQRKGTYDLLKSISQLDNQLDKDIHFYLCGDGDIQGVQQAVSDMHLSHRIAHIGWIDGEQKKQILQNTMLNVLPSYNEGLPMTILETMSYGIPNISTNIASIPEVIKPGINGLLIKPGDIDALTASILQLVSNESLRFSFSKASYQLITSEFSLDAKIEQLESLYNQFEQAK